MQNTLAHLTSPALPPISETVDLSSTFELESRNRLQIESGSSFIGISESDRRLQLLIDEKVCDQWGNPTEKFQNSSFEEILPETPPYCKIQVMIGSLQETSNPLDHNQLTVSELLRKLIEFPNKISSTIQDVQMIGNQVVKLLFECEELLYNSIEKIFGKDLTQNLFKDWISEINTSQVNFNQYEGQEIDFRIACSNASIDQLASLSSRMKTDFFERFRNAPQEAINKFHIINKHMTLVGFNFEKRPIWQFWEFLITNRPDTLSSDTCLWLSFVSSLDRKSNQNFKINCLGFSPAKFFIDLFCKIYTPYTFENPQVLIRLWYHSDRIPLRDHEEKMVEALLRPFEKVDSYKAYLEALMKLDYKRFMPPTTFSSASPVHEEFVTEYLSILIRRRIKAKMQMKLPPHPDSNAAFVFRCCQCLCMYKKLSDQAIAQLILTLNKEGLLIYPETHAFFAFCIPFIANRELPFSVISSMTTLIGWFYAPESFTSRQNPSIFFISEPFTLRVPTDLPAALNQLKDYLETGGNKQRLKEIHQFFTFKTLKNSDCYQKICRQLNLNEESLNPQLDFFLDHSDSFICSIGVQVKLIFSNRNDNFILFEKLPKLMELEFNHPLLKLYQQIGRELKSCENKEVDYASLAGWIQLFIQSNELKLTRLAYRLWKENGIDFDKNLGLAIFKALSRLDPIAAIPLYTELDVYETTHVNFSAKALTHLMQPPLLYLERIFPLLKQLLTGPQPDLNQSQKTLFTERTLNFIKSLENIEQKRFLSLALILKGYVKLEGLSEELSELLNPILPFLTYRQDHRLIFSLPETQSLLLLYGSLMTNDFARSWTKIFMHLFYSQMNREDEVLVDVVSSLEKVHEYMLSEECDLTLFNSIFNVLIPGNENPYSFRFVNGIERDLQSIKKLERLISSHHPLISYIALTISLHIENWNNFTLFLNAVPQLLDGSFSYQGVFNLLFERICQTYHLPCNPFNPLVLNDWVKVLAQSKNEELVRSAQEIWRKNQAKCEEKMHLKLFQALILTNPHSALLHFFSLHQSQQPKMTPAEYALCLKMISTHYPCQLIENDSERLYEIFNDLLDLKKTLPEKVYKNFSDALIWLIEQDSKSEQAKKILLKAIEKSHLRSKEIKENLLHLISSLIEDPTHIKTDFKKNHQRMRIEVGQRLLIEKNPQAYAWLDHFLDEEIPLHLFDSFYQFLVACLENIESISIAQSFLRVKKLIAMHSGKKPPQTLNILKKFFNKILQSDFKELSSLNLSDLDEMLVNYPEVIASATNWHQHLLKYLTLSQIPSRLNHTWTLFTFLLTENRKKSEIEDLELQRAFALLIQQYEYPIFSSSLQSLLNHPLQIVRAFIKTEEWKIAQIYLLAFNHYQLQVKNIILETWQVVFQFSKNDGEMRGLMGLLETQSFENWKRFFYEPTEQQFKLESLQFLINKLLKEINKENSRDLEWLILFMNLFLQQSSSKIALNLECTDKAFLCLIPPILSTSPSLALKEYLFLKRENLTQTLKEMVKNEIDNQLSTKKISPSFCLKLVERYFPNDFSIKFKVLKLLTIKDKQLIQQVILDLEKFELEVQEDLARCWIEVFSYLKRLHDSTIWNFLEKLPKVFEQEKFGDLRREAETIVIEGAALGLSNHPKTQSMIKELERMHNQDQLFKKISLIRKIPFELFMKVFNSFDESFINDHFDQCLMLIFKVFRQADSSILQKHKPSETFKNQLHTLIKNCVTGFDELIARNRLLNQESGLPIIDAMELCLKLSIQYLNFNQTPTCRHLLYRIFGYHFTFFDPLSNEKETYYYKVFSLYSSLSSLFNEDLHYFPEVEKLIVDCQKNASDLNNLQNFRSESQMILKEITPKEFSYDFQKSVFMTNQKQKVTNLNENPFGSKDVLLVLVCFLSNVYYQTLVNPEKYAGILEQALNALFPDTITHFPHSYFKLILNYIYLSDHSTKNKVNLNHLCVAKVLELLLQVSASEKKQELIKLKKIFEEGINWLINFYYQDENYNIDNFTSLNKILASTSSISIYSKDEDPWLIVSAYTLPSQKIVKALKSINAHVYFRAFRKLIEYETYASLKQACFFFSELIDYNNNCIEINRVTLFKHLLQALFDHSEMTIKKSCLLTYLNEKRFYTLKSFEHLPTTSPHFSYYKETLKIQFEIALSYIEKFQEENKLDLSGHYISCALQILEQSLRENFFSDNPLLYLQSLEKLIEPIVEIEKCKLGGEVVLDYSKLVRPYSLIVSFVNALNIFIEDAEDLILKQHDVLTVFLNKLFNNEEEQALKQEKKFNDLLDSLFNIIDHSLEKNPGDGIHLFSLIINTLQKYSPNSLVTASLKTLEFYFLSKNIISQEILVNQFNSSVELLIDIPFNLPYWKFFYKTVYLGIYSGPSDKKDLTLY